MNRRELVKTLAMFSVVRFSNFAWAKTHYGCDPNESNDPYVHLIFHGLFFMQFANGGLEIAAPKLSASSAHHELLGGQLGHISEIKKDLNFSSVLQKGPVTSFKKWPSIAQFSLQESGVKADLSKGRAKIALPQPEEIVPLRPGALGDLKMADGNVQKSLQKACAQGGNQELAISVCLRYQSTAPPPSVSGAGPLTLHFYSESLAGEHTIKEMNDIYKDPMLKTMVTNFDLQLAQEPNQLFVGTKDACSWGVTDQDQLSLHEITALTAWYDSQVALLKNKNVKSQSPGNGPDANHRSPWEMRNVKVSDCIPYALEP